MALTKFAVSLLAPHLRNCAVVAFGYPDMLITREEARELLGVNPNNVKPWGKHHKLYIECVDTMEVVLALGCTLRCYDVRPSRGVEIPLDLNEPQDVVSADVVLDAGTMEHCANIGQALKNIANTVAPGGVVFHSPPLSMVNHGFYNVNPTLLWDFYEQNGWNVLHLSAFAVRDNFNGFPLDAHARVPVQNDAALYFLAQRPRGTPVPLIWPTQQRYMK